MKNITHLVFMIILISLKSSFAFAGNGYCTSVDGAANLQYDWGTYTLTDVAQNTPGTILAEKQLNASGSPVTLNCDCSGGPYQNAWIWGDTTLSGKVTVGDYNYYDMPDNDYLQVGVVVYTQKDNIWHPLPFGPISNVNNGDAYSCNQDFLISTGGTHTGSQIKVSLRIKKSFVGMSTFSSVLAGSTYWTLGDQQTGHGGSPATNIYISGAIIVPQTCSINAGEIVTVDFGSFYSAEFKNKGQAPTGYTAKTVSVPVKCNGMEANANLTLRFEAEPATDEPTAIKTTNDDVGVQITDSNGNIVTPNSGLIPFQLDDNLQATVTFHAAPISTTGQVPGEGTFSAHAYLRVDFA